MKSKRKASASQKMLVTTVARSREEERPHFLASQDPQGKGTWADWLAAICKGHVHTLRSRRLGGMPERERQSRYVGIQTTTVDYLSIALSCTSSNGRVEAARK